MDDKNWCHARRSIGLVLGLCVSALLMQCENPLTDTELIQGAMVCPHKDDIQSSGPGNPRYRVISPNDGESYSIGDTVVIRTTSEEMGEANLRIVIGQHRFQIPGISGSFMTQEDTVHSFVIPANFTTANPDNPAESLRFSAVSDSCLIMLVDYEMAEFYDYSDCYFAITPMQE